MGKHCEECLPGYYGDALTGVCQICSCPLPIESNKSVSINQLSNNLLLTSQYLYKLNTYLQKLSNKFLLCNSLDHTILSLFNNNLF